MWEGNTAKTTYQEGKEALGLWLNGSFPSLRMRSLHNVKIESKSPFSRESVLEDLIAAAHASKAEHKLRFFDPDKDGIVDGSLANFLAAWENKDAATPLTALGFKATKKGMLSCTPTLPIHKDEATGKVIAVIPEKYGWIPLVRTKEIIQTKSRQTANPNYPD